MRILVVDLLGGLGDLVMVLPAVHALARRHPDAELHVLTHAPGDQLLRHDPAVATVHRAPRGAERAAVVEQLEGLRPDLVVSTTRYDGIADEIAARSPRSVTNLWRRPPPDEPISHRYLRILAEEGLVDPGYRPPRIHLTGAERTRGRSLVTFDAPVVLVPDAGMAVKRWPHWDQLVAALEGRSVLVVGERDFELDATAVPPVDLRLLAALFAAVGERGGVVVGGDTGPVRVAAAVGARTVGLFGPTAAARYGLADAGPLPRADGGLARRGRRASSRPARETSTLPSVDLQGLPGCPHRRPTAITEQVCWWEAACPLSAAGPACMADIAVEAVLAAVG